MTRRSLLCPRPIRPSRCAEGCHGDCPLSFTWNTSQGFNACVHMHVAAGNLFEQTLLPVFFVRLPLCFGWVFLGVGGGGCVGVGVCAGCAPCAASVLVLSVRILGLASNSDLDIVTFQVAKLSIRFVQIFTLRCSRRKENDCNCWRDSRPLAILLAVGLLCSS